MQNPLELIQTNVSTITTTNGRAAKSAWPIVNFQAGEKFRSGRTAMKSVEKKKKMMRRDGRGKDEVLGQRRGSIVKRV